MKRLFLLTLFAAWICAANLWAWTGTLAADSEIQANAGVSEAPTAVNGLVYTGAAQVLVNAGAASGGTLNYSLDNIHWTEDIPTATAAGAYTVYYMVVGDATHLDFTPDDNTIAVTVAKAPLTIKADNTFLIYGDPAWWCNHATYIGFVNGEIVTVLSGAVQFDNEYTTGANVGTYMNTPYGVTAANYDITFVPGTVTVYKADVSFTAPTAISGLEYTGAAQVLVNAGAASGGTMQYRLNDGVYSTDLPTATDPATYTVYYKVIGDNNHNNVAEASVSVTIAAPSGVDITANQDPQNAGVYYSTFFDSAVKYELPAGVEAYVATLNSGNLYLTKIAVAGQVIPNDEAVILKSTVTPFTLTTSEATPVSLTVENSLQGTDAAIATPANCYVLGGADGVVGFYQYGAPNLNPHKAYVVLTNPNNAPRRMPFIFDAATGMESIQPSAVSSQKVLRDGQLIIIRDGVRYNVFGAKIQ